MREATILDLLRSGVREVTLPMEMAVAVADVIEAAEAFKPRQRVNLSARSIRLLNAFAALARCGGAK